MGFNEQNFSDRIDRLEKNYREILDTRNFLNDNTTELRQAVSSIKMDFSKLRETIKKSEETLLIGCYTIAEQMLKEAKYEILGFDNTSKTNLQKFLNSKIDPMRFSPNAKIERLSNTLGSYIIGNASFGLLYGKSSENLKIYDDMICSRHTYAHKGDYDFDIEKYQSVIETLRYLYFEYSEFLFNENLFKIKTSKLFEDVKSYKCLYSKEHLLCKKKSNPDFSSNIEEFLGLYEINSMVAKPLLKVRNLFESILEALNDLDYSKVSSLCQELLRETGNR